MGAPGTRAGGSVPIYEYQCPDCGYQFEQLQKISDAPIRVCPNCQAEHLKKLVSQTSFVLKGGGWYKDHYGLKGGEGKSGKAESGTTKEPAPSGGDKPAPADKPAAAPAASSETKPAPSPKKTPSSAA
jgi:putative FmdB family regulatory protein